MSAFGHQGPLKGLGKILFPVDFSERARAAAPLTRALACHFEGRVTLLHALPVPHYEFGMGMIGDLYPGRVQGAEEELTAFGARELRGVAWNAVVRAGDPASLIVDYARHERVDLVAMPTHGLGTFRRYLLGSTTAKVLHDAECPVLTGAHLGDGAPVASGAAAAGFDRILCAVDLKGHSARVLEWAAGLARAYRAELHAVHVVEALPPEAVREPRDNWDRDLVRNAQGDLDVLTMRVAPDARNAVLAGSVPRAVAQFATEHRAQLLVIGRAATGGLFGRLRNNAYDLIRESPCPVASV